MNKILITLASLLACVQMNANIYNVKDFGAKADGRTIDSPAINKAIDEAARNGGGTVVVPAGEYTCYSIRLQSHICLMLENGAKIIAAYPEEHEGFDAPEENPGIEGFQDFGHSHWKNSLIWGIGLEDVTICGSGLIYGKGLTREESHIPGVGNKAISLKNCNRVTIKDISILHGGHFALLATGIENLSLLNIKVDTNRDGFDIDCCRNVRVSDCTVNAPWDDAIVLKASYALGRFKDTENVTITGCCVSGFDPGTVYSATYEYDIKQAPDHDYATGRIKLGTESSGGFKNIAITNCVFDHCRGLALETVDGGQLEDVTVSNITMRHITNCPIFLRLGARLRSPKGTPVGSIKRVSIQNVTCYDADSRYASIISGIPGHNIEDVTLRNIRIYHQGGYSAADAPKQVPEMENRYPEPSMFHCTMPAKGFYIRHARGVKLQNIDFHFDKPDGRPLIVTDDAEVEKSEISPAD